MEKIIFNILNRAKIRVSNSINKQNYWNKYYRWMHQIKYDMETIYIGSRRIDFLVER